MSIPGVDPSVPPSGTGCVECDENGGWWVHLRRCTQCGHIGCCDNSPEQHGRKHATSSGHTMITSFEPGEDWFYDFSNDDFYESGPALAPPDSHPADQPVPGPKGRVPADWQSKLNA
ncbi:UBP-type zinc finger domain-containing protein [Catenulispora rubra]|uniref:UBP-type zinc finger domain-containing protein n=1 Tax=Catenulispora rubra TaxID=280293 RepID=UPI001891F46D|nr:UBP-type zinc finger domain-containing protein [Catenulispora rubra]